jgi:hypothetical protein
MLKFDFGRIPAILQHKATLFVVEIQLMSHLEFIYALYLN